MSIVTQFLFLLCRIDGLPNTAGIGKIFCADHEVDMAIVNNAIRQSEIQAAVNADQGVFRKIISVSLATTDRVFM